VIATRREHEVQDVLARRGQRQQREERERPRGSRRPSGARGPRPSSVHVGGPDMAPTPPTLGSAPGNPWRSSSGARSSAESPRGRTASTTTKMTSPTTSRRARRTSPRSPLPPGPARGAHEGADGRAEAGEDDHDQRLERPFQPIDGLTEYATVTSVPPRPPARCEGEGDEIGAADVDAGEQGGLPVSAVARIALPQRQCESRAGARRSAPAPVSASRGARADRQLADGEGRRPVGGRIERSSAVQRRTASAWSARARPKPISSEFLIRVSS